MTGGSAEPEVSSREGASSSERPSIATPTGDAGQVAQVEELTRAVRRLVAATVHTGVRGPELDGVIAGVRQLTERLDAAHDDDPWAARISGRSHDLSRMLPMNPVMGRCNPLAAEIDMEVEADRVVWRTQLGIASVGPPGRVHGGVVAALLDQVLGFACFYSGHPGMTASLTVHYRKATPIDEPLEIEARFVESKGRRGTAWGCIRAGGEMTAEAEGLFVLVQQPGPPA